MRRSWLVGSAVFLAVFGSSLLDSRASASTGTQLAVALGRTESSVRAPVASALRGTVEDMLSEYGGVPVTARRRASYVLDVTLLRMRAEPSRDGVSVRCEVSLFVSDAATGAVRAVLSGRGGVQTDRRSPEVDRTALMAAVRSAVRPLRTTLLAIPRS